MRLGRSEGERAAARLTLSIIERRDKYDDGEDLEALRKRLSRLDRQEANGTHV
jgi:hypothetical protein